MNTDLKEVKFSILIPTFNRKEFLEICVQSALSQEYPSYEVIVSDNASTDGTEFLMQKYVGHPKLRYIRNETNIGMGANWENLLYKYATGDYGIILPDDDYLVDSKHLVKASEIIKKYEVGYIFTDSLWIDEFKKRTTDINYELPAIMTPHWAIKNIAKRLRKSRLIFMPGLPSVFNLKIAKELNVLRPPVCGFDGELGIRFMLSGNTAYLKGAQRAARTHPQASGLSEEVYLFFEGLDVYLRAKEFAVANNLNKKDIPKFQRRLISIHMKNLILPIWFTKNKKSISSWYKMYKTMYIEVKKRFNFISFLIIIFSFEFNAKIITILFPKFSLNIRKIIKQ